MRRNRISGEAYDINKLTIYIAQKSEMESRVELITKSRWQASRNVAPARYSRTHRWTG